MFSHYYKQEMEQLKELGGVFAKAHPALAPMLSGQTADPDVERLLEGVSFQTALLRQKLDDEFPEIIQDLIRLLWPHYLRPIPSTSTVAFSPKPTMKQPAKIPAGTRLASIPVEGTTCYFKTCYDVDIHPLSISDAVFEQPSGQPPQIRLVMALDGLTLSDWPIQSLRLFLAGDYNGAADLYFLLMRHLRKIVLQPLGPGDPVALPGHCLKEAGFSEGAALLPYPPHSFPGYRMLQEYFYSPEKFLYLDLTGWDQWRNRGNESKFEIRFEFDDLPVSPPRLAKNDFALFTTPVINLFPHEADPIFIDHHKDWYYVRPASSTPDHYQIYSVDKVSGYIQARAAERVYQPFDHFDADFQSRPVYNTNNRRALMKTGTDVYLAVAYPQASANPATETLSISLTCTNGSLPETLRVGDICVPTGAGPEFVTFGNIKPLTPAALPPLGNNFLWRLISHLSLNYLSLANPDNLRALLDLYVFSESQNQSVILANKKRISSIEHLDDKGSDRLFRGMLIRGRDITMKLRKDHFASTGDMFIFGCVLDQFLGGYASINSFTTLTIQEVLRGERYSWPARLGNQPLI
ncbi:MAG: type VI secretion system baseplate subunit TssF [Smithellaceae bacterium]